MRPLNSTYLLREDYAFPPRAREEIPLLDATLHIIDSAGGIRVVENVPLEENYPSLDAAVHMFRTGKSEKEGACSSEAALA